MPAKRYIVTLTAEERQSLEKLIKTGKSASQINHAHILLKADVNHEDGKINPLRKPLRSAPERLNVYGRGS